MVDSKKLKILAGGVVVGSKLSKASKLQLLNFIQKEATNAQIKALLLDGSIVQLDKQAEQIVNERFSNSRFGKASIEVLQRKIDTINY